jgi:hypothetical protein
VFVWSIYLLATNSIISFDLQDRFVTPSGATANSSLGDAVFNFVKKNNKIKIIKTYLKYSSTFASNKLNCQYNFMNNTTVYANRFVERHGNRLKDSLSIISQRIATRHDHCQSRN